MRQAAGARTNLGTVPAARSVGNAVVVGVPLLQQVPAVFGVDSGVDSGVAVSATLLFRLLTFWLPTLPGYWSFNWLQRVGSL